MDDIGTRSYLVIGAGVLGIQIARLLKIKNSSVSVTVIEKCNAPFPLVSSMHSGLVHHPHYFKDPEMIQLVQKGRDKLLTYCHSNSITVWPLKAKIRNADDEYEIEMPVINIDEFNKNLYEEALRLGVVFIFNKEFSLSDLASHTKVINCAGIGSLKIAQKFNLAPNLFQLNFKQMHTIDSTYAHSYHLFPNLTPHDVPTRHPHWIHSPAENIVKYGPFLHPLPIKNYLSSPLKSILGFLILMREFGFFELVRKGGHIFKRGNEMEKSRPYSKKPVRALVFNKKTFHLLTKPEVIIDEKMHSVHIINYYSPGFTVSFQFAEDIVTNYLID